MRLMMLALLIAQVLAGCSLLLSDRDGADAGVPTADASTPVMVFPFGELPAFNPASLPEIDWTAFACLFDTAQVNADCGVPDPIFAIETHGGEQLAVLRANAITIDVDIDVTGPHPLVLVARRIVLTGHIEAGSTLVLAGPGARGLCPGGPPDNQAAGGGGGGYGTDGAGGGSSAGGDPGGVGGIEEPIGNSLRGGCRGGTTVVDGGQGGGALQLVATDHLTFSGSINVGGAGGRGSAANNEGGGGGGSGGVILIEAPDMLGDGKVGFFGGGGGRGNSLGAGGGGDDGDLDGGGAGGQPLGGAGAGPNGNAIPGGEGVAAEGGGGGGGGGGRGFCFTRDPTEPSSPLIDCGMP